MDNHVRILYQAIDQTPVTDVTMDKINLIHNRAQGGTITGIRERIKHTRTRYSA